MPRRKFTSCPKCFHWNEQPHGATCTECGAGFQIVSGKTTTNGAWGNKGGQSLRFAFDPDARAEMAETAPATADAIRDDGTLVYRSAGHQKRVFREMAIAKEQHAEKQAPKVARNERRLLTPA